METITVLNRNKLGMMWVDLKKLITFIAGVINANIESKSERIQIMVKQQQAT